ncbi:MAG TPA: hypothetical protein VGF52_07060 [Tepidisphaeraceae bacterium]|jgi:hypothetical protein
MLSILADAPGQLTPTEWWTLIVLGVFGLFYMAVLRPMMRKKDPLDRPAAFASLSQQRNVERQMQNLLVELSEMARQITAQLDTRAAKLEALIREADEKIAAMNSQNNTSSQPYVALPSSPPALEEMPDPRHAEVYALADQGRNAGDIAAELGRPRGEVELILALRSR